jgi:trimeric autotransporter adhesin
MQFDTASRGASFLRNVAAALVVAVATTGCFEEDDRAGETDAASSNAAPLIQLSPTELTLAAGQAMLVTPSASDPDGDALTFTIVAKPVWANFDSRSGTLSGTPSSADAGVYDGIVISASDGKDTTAGPSLRVVVQSSTSSTPTSSPNSPPSISGTPGTSVTEEQAYTFTPAASDPDGQPLTFSIANRPAWASFSASTGRLAGTPPIGAAGSYMNIVISVSDGSASSSLPAFTIVVERANRAPTITGTPATSGREGQAYSFQPGAADPDGDALTFSIGNKPAWASFNTATGLLSGTPPAGSAGTYSSIVISVSDGRLSSSLAAFLISVAANRAPTITGTPATATTVGQSYSFTPSASDPDGQALTFSIANKPAWASFSTSTGRCRARPRARTSARRAASSSA